MATARRRGNSFIIEASCGYDKNGRRRRRYMTWKPDPGMTEKQIEKELERQKFLFDEKCSDGYFEGRITFEDFAEIWFKEYAEQRYKIRTLERCQQFKGRVFAAIGHLSMDKITTRTVQRFMINLAEPGIKKVKTRGGDPAPQALSVKSLKNYLSFISTVFRYAISQGVVKDNPAHGVVLPQSRPAERDCYTLEEAQQFLELLENEPFNWRVFFTLAVYTGLRRGELYGLEWQDIDFDNSTITVNRESQHTSSSGTYTDTPKTRSSRRCLKIPQEVLTMLTKYKAWQTEQRLKAGDKWQESGRLFVTWDGRPLNPNSCENWLKRFFRRTGMRRVTVHSFRHLNATLLIGAGADIRTVSAVLGHSQTSTTLNIYAHSFAAQQAAASEAVANILELHKKTVQA
ncbi:MAG: site-specific integrase [Oscillospiraceae bacterium]|nr:site-specific integrase [Oscillospiraceae bacterium]